jgi:hypothetical protein
MIKKSAFQKYITKWGLERYRFFAINKGDIIWICDAVDKDGAHFLKNVLLCLEVLDINTFIRKTNSFRIITKTTNEEFTLPELKQRALIEKLGGL